MHVFTSRECPGEGTFGAVLCVFLHEELQIITTKDIPETYRLYLLFVACARLCDLNLMGTREDFSLICMFGMLLLGYVFNKADVHRVLGQK